LDRETMAMSSVIGQFAGWVPIIGLIVIVWRTSWRY
jgi:hypothetical protein